MDRLRSSNPARILWSGLLFILLFGMVLVPSAKASWQIEIVVSTPDPKADSGEATNRLVIGVDPSATDSFDNTMDTVALLDGPVMAYVDHPGYPSAFKKLWRDMRTTGLPAQWEIHIGTSNPDVPVKVTWQLKGTDRVDFTLVDKDTGQVLSSTGSNTYSYTASSDPKILLLKVNSSTASSSPSSGGSSGGKGGGCGYIKSPGGDDHMGGEVLGFMVVLFSPLILSLLGRRYGRS